MKGNDMIEKEDKIVLMCTHAADNIEKATFPFVMANAAMAMDTKAVVVLQGAGVYLAKKGYTDHLLQQPGFEPIQKLMETFFELGGEMHVCVPCIKSRNIAESELLDGARPTAGGAVIAECLSAASVFTY
jgi:uncharacterized protein involved in oxidation of intracellular sulfur